MNDLQKNLLDWAEKTVKVYVDYANAHDDAPAFYTQSPLNEITQSPELLIMGINPGSHGTYKDQKISNPNWHLNGKDMTGEDLLKGNFCAKDDKTEWEHFWEYPFGKRIMGYLLRTNINPLACPQKYVLTNATFFATMHATGIKEELPKTCQCTLQLIETLRPKKILVLSSINTINQMISWTKSELIKRDEQRMFGSKNWKWNKGTICGIPFLGVPHPSARLKNADRVIIQDMIADFMAS
ncbi:MAG: hypothetical protein MJZ75_00165 [Paludibacteraceae bacterium]|nr:hypothetical protein [Paludibacteraceae bacterium]